MMSADNNQINQLWNAYIQSKLENNVIPLKKELVYFLTHTTIDFFDYEEFEYGEFGDIAIRYLDFLYGEEEVEIRRIDSVTSSFEPTWGFMHKKESSHFDFWVKHRFDLNEEETNIVLQWTDTFLRAIVKKDDR